VVEKYKLALTALIIATSAAFSLPASASSFNPFIIRGSATIDTSVPGQTEFVTANSGDKAGLGSNDINGMTLGSIANISIDRLDDEGRFASGSGPAVAPYLNFWITNGLGDFAVVANEPSNSAFQPLYNNGYSLSFADLSDKTAKIYENDDKSWLPSNGIGLTFADLAGFTIMAPTVAELTTGWTGLGTGAPRELNTNVAYGVNWVFGDTANNYVSGENPGYIVANAAVSAVPLPATAWLLAAAVGLLGWRGRKAA